MTQTPPDDTIEATFAFVDLAGFTAMTEAHGDTEAVAIVRAFRDRALHVIGPEDELVKTIGDAVMLRFSTPLAAVVALRELLQQELVVRDAVLLPRAGAHHGPAMVVDGDYYGAAVNLAARVAGQARGGQLLVTMPIANVVVADEPHHVAPSPHRAAMLSQPNGTMRTTAIEDARRPRRSAGTAQRSAPRLPDESDGEGRRSMRR